MNLNDVLRTLEGRLRCSAFYLLDFLFVDGHFGEVRVKYFINFQGKIF